MKQHLKLPFKGHIGSRKIWFQTFNAKDSMKIWRQMFNIKAYHEVI